MLLGTVTSRAPYALSRGAVIGALSTSASEHMPPAELLVALQEAARAQGGEPSSSLATPLTNAYTNLHPIHLANARAGLKAVEVGQPLGREEAAGLFASLVKDRMLHSREYKNSCYMEIAGG